MGQIDRNEQGAARCVVYRLILGSRVQWLATSGQPPVIASLQMPADVISDPNLRLEIMYNGYDVAAARMIHRLAYMVQQPLYAPDHVEDTQSRFVCGDRLVHLFRLSLEPDMNLRVDRARIYARSARVKLKHMTRFCLLHGLEVKVISASSIRITSASRWTLTLVNLPDHCQWRADLGLHGLRWSGLNRLRGWSGRDSRQWMQALYDRMIGDQVRGYCEPTDRVLASKAFRKWKSNIPIPAASLRPSVLRAQGWNPAIPYKNWITALRIGSPRIGWM